MGRIYQIATRVVKCIWSDIKKDKSYIRGGLWGAAFLINSCCLAAIIALGVAFFALSALAIPFSAPSAGIAYLAIASFTVPLSLFLIVLVHQTYKHTHYNFIASA